MAILAECPICHRKQASKNRLCSCGADLTKAKKSKRVRYWITYRLPGGKQRREAVGYSIEEARVAEGKRKTQKYENPHILEKAPEEKMTFRELADWYLKTKSVMKLKSFKDVRGYLANFNASFGDTVVARIKPLDLEEYQAKREKQGRRPSTIDKELIYAAGMIEKAFDNDIVSGHTLKVFKKRKRMLKSGSNARKQTIGFEEFTRLTAAAPLHLKAALTIAFNTGMRSGEIRKLQWSHVDRENRFFRLPGEMTKEGKPKDIPINRHVAEKLSALPRAIHHDYVLTYKGHPIKERGGLSGSFATACQKAGISHGRKAPGGITFHDIRGTVKTNMLRAGMDKVLRNLILGHSLQGMDAYYMAPGDDDLRQAMDKYTRWIHDRMEIEYVDQNVDQAKKRGQPNWLTP